MNASISVVCYKWKPLSNGEYPLMLKVTKDGKRKLQSLGISVNPKHWDFLKNKPTIKCPNREYIQQIILDKQAELQKTILELNVEQKDYTADTLLNKPEKIIVKSVSLFYSELIDYYNSIDKRGNRRVYMDSLNSLKTFTGNNLNILFSDITVEWLKRYEKWLRSKDLKETSISLLFRTLRSAYNKAIEAKIVKKSFYPFDEYKLNKFDVTTEKRAISKEDIYKIMQVELSNELFYTRFSRDLFVFSYLCAGINLTDIANLDWTNIVNGRLVYVRQKTSKKISIPLNADSWAIIKKYSDDRTDNYLFPILDKNTHITATQIENRIHKVLIKVNKRLKEVAKLAEININLTTYVVSPR